MSNTLISMQKNGQTIQVNPLCVKDHQQLGWVIVPDLPVSAETPAEASDDATEITPSEGMDKISSKKAKEK